MDKSAARRLAEEMAAEVSDYVDEYLAKFPLADELNVYTRNQIVNKLEAKLGSRASGHQDLGLNIEDTAGSTRGPLPEVTSSPQEKK